MEVNVGAQACRRVRPPSLGDPRRRVAPVLTLAVASTCSLSLPFLLSLVLSPSPSSSSSSSFPHFLLPHDLAPRAPLARYTRAGACGTRMSRTFFDDKMAVVDLLTPHFSFYKVILISPFLLVGLIFRFVSHTSMRHFLFLPRQYYGRRQESLYLEDLEGPGAVDRPRRRRCHCRHCRRWRFRRPRQPSEPIQGSDGAPAGYPARPASEKHAAGVRAAVEGVERLVRGVSRQYRRGVGDGG